MRTTTITTETLRTGGERRFERRDAGYGRLHTPVGAPDGGVRRECVSCGAHLLAAPWSGMRLHGICMVCGGEEHRPVA